jgi:hypothetical protein
MPDEGWRLPDTPVLADALHRIYPIQPRKRLTTFEFSAYKKNLLTDRICLT